MANQPLAAVQAAILKSAAGQQGQKPATPTTLSGVQSDLAVMADQAIGYTAGAARGFSQATANSDALGGRLTDARGKADSFRAQQIETERLQKEQQDAQNQAQLAAIEQQRQEQQARFEASLAAQARARAESGAAAARAAHEQQALQQQANAYEVARRMKRDMPPEFSALGELIFSEAGDYDDAVEAINNIAKYAPEVLSQANPTKGASFMGGWGYQSGGPDQAKKDLMDYAKRYYDAWQGK